MRSIVINDLLFMSYFSVINFLRMRIAQKENKMEGKSVLQLVKDLCHSIRDESVTDAQLFRIAYNILLFEKVPRPHLPISPVSRVLSYVLFLNTQNDKDRLLNAVSLLQTLSQHSDDVFRFLCNLSNLSMDELTPTIADKYCSNIFNQLPSSSTEVSYSSIEVFRNVPLTSFYCNNSTSSSTLFSGLTHTSTHSLNVSLSVPPLHDEPPDPLTNYIKGYVTYKPAPPLSPPTSLMTQCEVVNVDDVMSLSDTPPPVSWEGPLEESLPYLSESGSKSFVNINNHFIDLLMSVSGGGGSHQQLCTDPRPLQSVEEFKSLLEQCFTLAERKRYYIELLGDEIVRAYYSSINSLLHYLQLKYNQLIEQDHSQFWIQSNITILMKCLLSLIYSSLIEDNTRGLLLLNKLYKQCITYQGLSLYPYLIGLLRQAIKPYLRFLCKWIYEGICIEGFGLELHRLLLETRDHRYWREGFSYGCVPDCVSNYKDIILNIGKSLNLLRLCCPKHHICNEMYSGGAPPLLLAESLEQVKELSMKCQLYQKRMEGLLSVRQKEREDKINKDKLDVLRPVLQAREEARNAIKELKEKEEREEREEAERKKAYLLELKDEVERAKALKEELLEMEREEEEEALITDVRNKELEESIRQELVEKYEDLTEEAVERIERSRWREKRFQLGTIRLQLLNEMKEEESELNQSIATRGDHTHQHPITSASRVSRVPQLVTDDIEAPPTALGDHTSQSAPKEAPTVVKGHTHQSIMQDILYPTEAFIEAPPTGTRGHAPSSVMQELLYPSRDKTPPTDEGTRGHAPQSVIKDILYPDKDEALPLDVETRDHTPQLFDNASPIDVGIEDHTPQSLTEESKPDESLKKSLLQTDEDKDEYDPVTCFSQYSTHNYPISEIPYQSNNLLILNMIKCDEEDKTEYYILSLLSLLEECISLPLLAQCGLINAAVIDYFIGDCVIFNHFELIKHYIMLYDGGFTDSLCTILFEELMAAGHSVYSSSFLSSTLHTALERSLYKYNDEMINNLSLTSARPLQSSTDGLKDLKLSYKVNWPLNIVITSENIDSLNKVFHFLLNIKRVSWLLKKTFVKLANKGVSRPNLSLQQLRTVNTHRQQLQHFLTVLESYISNQLFHISWNELMENLNKVKCLDDLCSCFAGYIEAVLSRCLLNKKAGPVLGIIDNILSSIAKFCSCLIDQVNVTETLQMTKCFQSFTDNCKLLFKVIRKLIHKGFHPFLQEILLRLNFNHYYS